MARITNKMMTNKYLYNMRNNLSRMTTYQNQLSTGKKITRPSDNPFVSRRNRQMENEISENTQYNTNINYGANYLTTTDTALAQAGNVLSRIKELMVKAGDGSYSQEQIATINKEVKEKTKELGQILNTTFDGSYIFGGTKSTTKPVTWDENGNIAYADDEGKGFGNADFTGATLTDTTKITKEKGKIEKNLNIEISQGVTIQYSKTAVDILEFTDPKTGNAVNVMETLSETLKNLSSLSQDNETPGGGLPTKTDAYNYIHNEGLSKMDAIIQNLLTNRSEVGTLQNRMTSAQQTNEDQNYNMTDILSNSEDIDFTETTMNFYVAQTVYTAALQTSSKVLMNTIMDYI